MKKLYPYSQGYNVNNHPLKRKHVDKIIAVLKQLKSIHEGNENKVTYILKSCLESLVR